MLGAQRVGLSLQRAFWGVARRCEPAHGCRENTIPFALELALAGRLLTGSTIRLMLGSEIIVFPRSHVRHGVVPSACRARNVLPGRFYGLVDASLSCDAHAGRASHVEGGFGRVDQCGSGTGSVLIGEEAEFDACAHPATGDKPVVCGLLGLKSARGYFATPVLRVRWRLLVPLRRRNALCTHAARLARPVCSGFGSLTRPCLAISWPRLRRLQNTRATRTEPVARRACISCPSVVPQRDALPLPKTFRLPNPQPRP